MNWLCTRHRTNPWERDQTDPLPPYMIPSNKLAYRPGTAPNALEYAKSVTEASGFDSVGYAPLFPREDDRELDDLFEDLRMPTEDELGRPVAPTDRPSPTNRLMYDARFAEVPKGAAKMEPGPWLGSLYDSDEEYDGSEEGSDIDFEDDESNFDDDEPDDDK